MSHPGEIRKLYSIAVRELDGKSPFGTPRFREYVTLWTGFYWLRIVNTAGAFRTGNESLSYTERGVS